MTIADIITEFGAYYLKNGQNMNRLMRQLRQTLVTTSVFTEINSDETVWRASESRHGRVIQPFQKAWTPIGEVEFKPVAIESFKLKSDVQDYPDDLESTWLGFLSSNNLDRKQWPFVRWWVEQELLPQVKEDVELNEIWSGVFAAPTPGTPGDAGTSMNGIRKAINDQVTATRITTIATGAPDASDANWVGQIEDFADAINQKYWMIPMQLCMNPTLARRFQRTNLRVKALPSMGTSTKIWCTPKNNSILLTKRKGMMDKMQPESVDRLVKLFTDFWMGVGFVIPEIVFTNDQDLL